jgi:hypothetical protein
MATVPLAGLTGEDVKKGKHVSLAHTARAVAHMDMDIHCCMGACMASCGPQSSDIAAHTHITHARTRTSATHALTATRIW